MAPKTGTIKKISWIAGAPGSFKFQVVKVKANGNAKATYESKTINYNGQSDPDAETYEIESAKVKAPVKKGQYLAIEASETSMLRCSSGGDNILLYQPGLECRRPVRSADLGRRLLAPAPGEDQVALAAQKPTGRGPPGAPSRLSRGLAPL